MKNRQTRYQSAIGMVLAAAFFLAVCSVIVIIMGVLDRKQPSEDEGMEIDFSLCPLCHQPTGFISKPPTIRYD